MHTTGKHSRVDESNDAILVVNYHGIGDAILAYPVIWSLALCPRFRSIAHPDTILYSDSAVRAFFPTPANLQLYEHAWYAFDTQYWDEIAAFAKKHRIGVILNIQNEGPLYDLGYYRFKTAYAGSFDFWDLDFDDIYGRAQRKPLLEDVRTLLAAKGVSWHTPGLAGKWQKSVDAVAIFVGGSESNKRWGVKNWAQLIGQLAQRFNKINFLVLTGTSLVEVEEIRLLEGDLKDLSNVTVRAPLSLRDNLEHLGRCILIISHDSYPIHFAGIEGIPAVGIYLATDPIIWGSFENPFFTFIASGEPCAGQKPGTGNCIHFHTGCPNIDAIKNGVTVSQVATVCMSAILDAAL